MKEQTSALVVMKSLQKKSQSIIQKLAGFTIQSQADFNQAGELVKALKVIAKEAKDKEDSLTTPLTKVIADIRVLFRPFRDTVAQIEFAKKAEMVAFINESKAKQQRLEQDYESGKIKKLSTLINNTNALEVQGGSAQIRKVWMAIAVDVNKTPREYLMPDECKIKSALKEGKKVTGWKWEQVESIAI